MNLFDFLNKIELFPISNEKNTINKMQSVRHVDFFNPIISLLPFLFTFECVTWRYADIMKHGTCKRPPFVQLSPLIPFSSTQESINFN